MNFIKRIINFFKRNEAVPSLTKMSGEEMGKLIQKTKTEAITEAQCDLIFGVDSIGRIKLLSELSSKPSDYTPVVFKYEHVAAYLNMMDLKNDPNSSNDTLIEALDAFRRNSDTIVENMLCMMSTQNIIVHGSSKLVELFNYYYNKIIFSGTRSIDLFISTEDGFLITHCESVQNDLGEALTFFFSIRSSINEETGGHHIMTTMDTLPYTMLEYLYDLTSDIYTMFILEVNSQDQPSIYLFSDDGRIVEDKCLFKTK